jgi:REP-associated tyrosine transposase
MPPGARTLALRHALFEHSRKFFMIAAVVMPDHVHLILRLLRDQLANESSLGEIMKAIKGISARRINQLLSRTGSVWREESFDHVVRSTEWSRKKIEYVCNNPVRAGLVKSADDYPWLWRCWAEGGQRDCLDSAR